MLITFSGYLIIKKKMLYWILREQIPFDETHDIAA